MPKETYRTPEERGTSYYQGRANADLFLLISTLMAGMGAYHGLNGDFSMTSLYATGYVTSILGKLVSLHRQGNFQYYLADLKQLTVPSIPVHFEKLGPLANKYFQRDLKKINQPSLH